MYGHGGRIIRYDRRWNSYVKIYFIFLCARESFLHCCERGRLESVPAGGGMMATMLPGRKKDDENVRTHHHAHAYAAQVRTRRRPNASEQLCLPDQSAPGTPIRPVRVWIRMHVATQCSCQCYPGGQISCGGGEFQWIALGGQAAWYSSNWHRAE